MPATADEIIASLQLEPLPTEGGFFRRTYTSAAVQADARPLATAIYFLVTRDGFSALHSLATDELWHFYAGDPVEHLMLDPHLDSGGALTVLGTAFGSGQRPQLVVPGGVWQGARLAAGDGGAHGWALLGCTLAPGWDPQEFTLGKRVALSAQFPHWTGMIQALTR